LTGFRSDLDVLPAIAQAGLACVAKDISQGGIVGTAMMLAECSGVAMTIDVAAIPRPDGAPLARWLQTFPSYGYILSVAPAKVGAVIGCFAARGISAAEVGEIAAGRHVAITDGQTTETVWDFAREPLIGCGQRQAEKTEALA
jgi:selenophosphate synthetase-related protein